MANSTTKEGKTAALISYIPVIGAPIAFFLNKWIIYSYFGLTAGDIGKGGVLVLFILGGLGALKEQEKLVPFLGDKFQEWFKNI